MRPLRSVTPCELNSWTDDVPVCKHSGVAFSTNQIYREDGNRQEIHEFEDKSFHCKFETNHESYLYGVFDGHEGVRAVDFCSQRMAAELILGQLNSSMSDAEIKEVIRQAFISAERAYMESLNDLLAERTSLLYEIPSGMNSYEAYQRMPDVVENIKKINWELSSGCTAAVCLIYNKKLFVGNVGNCRVLLCQTDNNNVLKVIQLSIDHDLKNEDELLRLSQIGLNVEVLRKRTHLGNQECTRCLGNYLIKDGYREIEELANAFEEPILAEPDVIGGVTLDDRCRFLLIMSSGFHRCVEEAIGAIAVGEVNRYVAKCIVEQFREQATLTTVAQAVVDKIVRLHHDRYLSAIMSTTEASSNALGGSCSSTQSHESGPSGADNRMAMCDIKEREDITLVLRNFGYISPNSNALRSANSPLMHQKFLVAEQDSSRNQLQKQLRLDDKYLVEQHSANTTMATSLSVGISNFTDTTDKTGTTMGSSSDDMTSDGQSTQAQSRIEAYVDFNEFYESVQRMKANGTLPDDI